MDSEYANLNYFSVSQTLEIKIFPKVYLNSTSHLEYRSIFEA